MLVLPLAGLTRPAAAQMPPLGQHKRVAVLEKALADFDEGLALGGSDPEQAAGLLRASAEGLEQLIRDGVENGRLHYNLGNTYLQLGRLGPAIASYRRAERLIPGNAQLEANLEFARNLRRNRITAAGSRSLLRTLFFWHYQLGLPTRFLTALVLYVVFWMALTARPWLRRAGIPAPGGPAVVLAAGWLTFGTSVMVEWKLASRTVAGVVTADDVVVRKGNGTNYEPQFSESLYEGVEFILIESRGDWLRVELPDGNTGWIRADQAEII